MTSPADLDLRFLIPATNENRWSDLLASLISTDPEPMAQFVGTAPDTVRREVVVPNQGSRQSDRLDLLLLRGGVEVGAIEVKVLADTGPTQLARYLTAFPDAGSHLVLHLARLPVTLRRGVPWRAVTWEAVLTAYSGSTHPWVAATAAAWLGQLDWLVPPVEASTVWNDVPDDAGGFELALRARIVWLATRMDAWCDLEHDLSMSSGGGAWVAAMSTPSTRPDHSVVAELQEGLTAQAWKRDPARPYRTRLVGPVVLVGLRQDDVSTSAGFEWPLLHRLFADRVVDQAGKVVDGRNWHRTAANPRDPTDRHGWQSIVDAGAPSWVGKGWGMAVARSTYHACAFGARFTIPPTSTLHEIDGHLQQLEHLITSMAQTD